MEHGTLKIETVRFDAPVIHSDFIRLMCVQMRFGRPAWEDWHRLVVDTQPDVIVFPEYAWYGNGDFFEEAEATHERLCEILERTRAWSSLVIGGTLLEKREGGFTSYAPLVYRGEILARYEKLNPTRIEKERGIRPGQKLMTVQWGVFSFSVLICADIFRTTYLKDLGKEGVHLVFVPTASPYRPDDSPEEKASRDRKYFMEGADLVDGVVVKVCGVGSLFHSRFQGRSLVVTRAGYIWRVRIEDEHRPVIGLIDLPLNLLDRSAFMREIKFDGRSKKS